jgi:hypothetical protein
MSIAEGSFSEGANSQELYYNVMIIAVLTA